jgi:hypothetical protein
MCRLSRGPLAIPSQASLSDMQCQPPFLFLWFWALCDHVPNDVWCCVCLRRPYIYDAVQLLDTIEFPSSSKPDGLEFVHFPIVDCAVVSDTRVQRLCKDLVKRLLKGENMYIHCWCVWRHTSVPVSGCVCGCVCGRGGGGGGHIRHVCICPVVSPCP